LHLCPGSARANGQRKGKQTKQRERTHKVWMS
jgi:hypothetical protein